MPEYAVYATRWDDPHMIEELIPTRGLEFSMPLSAHGDCSFSATVEPAKSAWRPSISPPVSGILVCRDDVPVWSGWVTDEPSMTGPRTFSFRATEWGAFFERVPAVPHVYTSQNDHVIFRDLLSRAMEIQGQNPAVTLGGPSAGGATSNLTINAWDDTTVAREFTQLAQSAGGPEWYFDTAGTMASPVRQLMLGDRLGSADVAAVLEFVEDTEDYVQPEGAPHVALLGDLFPLGTTVPNLGEIGRRGGNVIAQSRSRSAATSATASIAYGAGSEAAQIRATQEADDLLAAGWPRLTRSAQYSDVSVQDTLQRHADADLAASRGVATVYSLVTLDGDPEWTQVERGSTARIILDTDVYGAERPVGGLNGFTSRVLNMTVRVPDDGGKAQVQWDTATVQETT